MGQNIQKWTNENLRNIDLKEFELKWSNLTKPYHFLFFKGYVPQILLCPFLNTLSQIKPDQASLIIDHNILELYYVLVQVRVATSKAKFDI